MRINYDYGDLATFLAVKDAGSFHGAADHLNLSQSAVTRRIHKLEQALDTVLFERTTRAVKPTLAAKRLQARAEAALADARETAQAMRDESVAYAYQRGAVVTLATIPTASHRVLFPAISNLRAQGVVSRIRLLDGSANEVAEAVAQGDADFGLCSIPTLEPTTVFETLFEDRMVLAVPREHDLAERDRLSWQDVSMADLILPARGTGNRLLIDEAMARVRIRLSWAFEVGRTSTALDLVADNAGVALVPESATRGRKVHICTLTDPDISRPVGLLSRIGQVDTDAVAELKDAIRSMSQ